jgi:16S rRNA (guanine966-N2)-methyltransferase
VPDRGVRPTSERTREAIFDILGPGLVEGARVLDLFAGTGAMGIEALSRGAERADFVDGSGTATRMLSENLRALGLDARGRVHRADLIRPALPAGIDGPWGLIFLDPPYDDELGPLWVEALARGSSIGANGCLVYERRKGTAAPHPAALTLATERTYGDTTVAFYRAGSPAGEAPGGEK